MRIHTHRIGTAALALLAMLAIGCQTAPKTQEAKADLESDAQHALSQMRATDESLEGVVEKGVGHVIFPNAGKGGLILGGGYGRGVVYDEANNQIGFADITQLSAGAQIGGQAFAELLVFQTKEALDRFKNNQLTFRANASAVIVKAGAAASATAQDGVLVFIMPKAGAMAEATISGQRFTYTSAESGSGQSATRPAQRASGTESGNESETDTAGAEAEIRTTETKTEIKTEERRNAD